MVDDGGDAGLCWVLGISFSFVGVLAVGGCDFGCCVVLGVVILVWIWCWLLCLIAVAGSRLVT